MIRFRPPKPSDALAAAREKQIANGNHPSNTRLTREQKNDRPWDILLGPQYRQALEEKLRALAEEIT